MQLYTVLCITDYAYVYVLYVQVVPELLLDCCHSRRSE